MKLPPGIFKHHNMEPNWGVGVKFNGFLTLTPYRASVPFHLPVPLLSRKEPSEIAKQGVEIWYVAIS